MQANDWWKTLSLFLWFYNTSATGLVLLYFYGICSLAERKFEGRIFAALLLPFFVVVGASTLIFSLSSSIITTNIWLAVWPCMSGLLLLFVVYRAYRVMMG